MRYDCASQFDGVEFRLESWYDKEGKWHQGAVLPYSSHFYRSKEFPLVVILKAPVKEENTYDI